MAKTDPQPANVIPIEERRSAAVWFFSKNVAMAHNGYYTEATFKVWKLRRQPEPATACENSHLATVVF